MSAYISFDTFHSLCKKKLTIDNISNEITLQNLKKFSKAKETQHFSLFYNLRKNESNIKYLKSGTDKNIMLNQRAECCFELITNQCHSQEKQLVKSLANKFLFRFLPDNIETKDGFINSNDLDDESDVFLVHFLFFFSFLQDSPLIGSSLTMQVYEVRNLNISYKAGAALPEKFRDVVVNDHVEKIYRSTLFMLFGTKPFRPDKNTGTYKAIYLYNMAIIQYKLSCCIERNNEHDHFYKSEKNKLPAAPIIGEMFNFLAALKMSNEYPSYCETLGSLTMKVSFKIEESGNKPLNLSNREYGDLIISHLEREKHSSKNKHINNMYNLTNADRTPGYLKKLHRELNNKFDAPGIIYHDFIKTNNNNLTLPDIVNIIFFHEHSVPMICQPADSELREPRTHILNNLYKLKESKIKIHAAFLKKISEKLEKDINSIHISENEA